MIDTQGETWKDVSEYAEKESKDCVEVLLREGLDDEQYIRSRARYWALQEILGLPEEQA